MVLLPGLTWAARPLDTEDPGTVPPGKLEVQGSVDYTKDDSRLMGMKGVLGMGLLSNMDIRVQSSLLWVDPLDEPIRGGLGDTLFGFKHRLLDETDTLPAVMCSFTLRLPTGSAVRGLGDRGVDAALFAVVGKTFGPVTLNLRVLSRIENTPVLPGVQATAEKALLCWHCSCSPYQSHKRSVPDSHIHNMCGEHCFVAS